MSITAPLVAADPVTADNVAAYNVNAEGPGSIIVQSALVNLDSSGITETSSNVSSWVNSGTGGSDYDLDVVVGTGANLKKSISDTCLMYGASGDYLATPDSVANSITGDIDIRWHGSMPDWTPASPPQLVAKWNSTTNNRSYRLAIAITTGYPELITDSDGTGASGQTYTATAAPSFTDGEAGRLRVTLDVDDGAGGSDARFYTSTDGDTWTQLGSTVHVASTTSIFDGAAVLEFGSINSGTFGNEVSTVYSSQIYNGIDGTLAVDFNAADYVNKTSDTTFPSSTTGEVWTLNGNTFIQNTGQDVVHSIGSVGLETTAGQTIASPGTVFAVARFSDAAPVADNYIMDSKTSSSLRWIFATDNATADKFAFYQGDGAALVPISEAYDTSSHVFTGQFKGDATSKLTVSSLGDVSGDGGSQDWEYGTLMAAFNGSNTMQGFIGGLVVFDRALTETEIDTVQTYLSSLYRL